MLFNRQLQARYASAARLKRLGTRMKRRGRQAQGATVTAMRHDSCYVNNPENPRWPYQSQRLIIHDHGKDTAF